MRPAKAARALWGGFLGPLPPLGVSPACVVDTRPPIGHGSAASEVPAALRSSGGWGCTIRVGDVQAAEASSWRWNVPSGITEAFLGSATGAPACSHDYATSMSRDFRDLMRGICKFAHTARAGTTACPVRVLQDLHKPHTLQHDGRNGRGAVAQQSAAALHHFQPPPPLFM